MKIIKLESENIKRIKAVEIKPDGAIVRITGKNASGKTSVLDSILYALGGEREIPTKPIRQGAKKAHIRLDLGDMVVERNITTKGSYLKVTGKDGKNIGSPQRMLDDLVGKLSFDPLGFSRDAPKKQAEILRALAGLDTSDLDKQETDIAEERRTATAEGKMLAAQLEGSTAPPADLPDAPVDVSDLQSKLRLATESNERIDQARMASESAANYVANTQRALEKAKQDAEDAVAALKTADKALVEAGEPQDITEMTAAIGKAYETNHAIDNANRYRAQHDKVEKARAGVRKLNQAIEAVREERAQRIADAKYPLDGLGISEDGEVMFGGLPISQASLAEQLKVSTAVAMALNPKLRVIRITDGSLLDSESIEVIESLATGNEYQVWIEQVDETGEVGFYIQDGSIAAIDGVSVDD